MGLDPTDDSYTVAIPSPECDSPLFGGSTPLFIRATISGVLACHNAAPGTFLPNGIYNLRQTAEGLWIYFAENYLVSYGLGIMGSSCGLTTYENDDMFDSRTGTQCVDMFFNQLTCDDAVPRTYGGTCIFEWGPSIGA